MMRTASGEEKLRVSPHLRLNIYIRNIYTTDNSEAR